ncbi:hypothetical protein AMAG_02813 [Allomyces macrogynus ATCC 38327]|uniref:Uncharacterized protein n=1 Tax=Allomyces macrogynus (strain ATCC 38327) TaxID=578462 RepID=A0A0L0S3S9_ALLM3|nr:hypothetical protein AMAG_02813 [Allomyces macrogynus ATCC 38327]|eukprot:KNE57055.1 hypothetical protein AMAG_02813 [Allomyces macrogynus ATCC 38327]
MDMPSAPWRRIQFRYASLSTELAAVIATDVAVMAAENGGPRPRLACVVVDNILALLASAEGRPSTQAAPILATLVSLSSASPFACTSARRTRPTRASILVSLKWPSPTSSRFHWFAVQKSDPSWPRPTDFSGSRRRDGSLVADAASVPLQSMNDARWTRRCLVVACDAVSARVQTMRW